MVGSPDIIVADLINLTKLMQLSSHDDSFIVDLINPTSDELDSGAITPTTCRCIRATTGNTPKIKANVPK